jgi:hypothetical protein
MLSTWQTMDHLYMVIRQLCFKMGKEGWELVSTYTEIGTSFPNFGNSEYVTGLRDNTRTCVVNFVFKRMSDGKDPQPKDKTKDKAKK